jgi:hypothetical protein
LNYWSIVQEFKSIRIEKNILRTVWRERMGKERKEGKEKQLNTSTKLSGSKIYIV